MHRSVKVVLGALGVALALIVLLPRDARACGGCFHDPISNTQVSYHRMVLSISQQQSTLWDEIRYTGNDPTGFAWVLPIRGPVTVGLSSDLLFAGLDQLSAVTVFPPPYQRNCPYCGCGFGETDTATDTGTDTGTGSGGGVTIISQAVVGPYDTVQLSSTDPNALETWLSSHGYVIPADIAPLVAAYVAEGFDFLALRLMPGAGVEMMKPVRVTTPGASPVLPLRMVAAGTGANVPITLFVMGQGRWEPSNFPWFTTTSSQLVYDYTTGASNYTALEQAGFKATLGRGWHVESAQALYPFYFENIVQQSIQIDPVDSGYGDMTFNGASMAAQADLDTLFSGLGNSPATLTRMHAELPRAALAVDLTLGAAEDQSQLPTTIVAATALHQPACDCSCPCDTGTGTDTGTMNKGSSCAVAMSRGAASAAAVFFFALGLTAVRRRRGRART